MTKEEMAVQLTCSLESFRSAPYLDNNNVPTIAFGTTIYPNGTRVTLHDDECTQEQGKLWIEYHLEKRVYPLIAQYKVPDGVYASLASFVYNIGHVGASLDLVLKTTPLDLDELTIAFRKYVNSGGKFCQGLLNRRNAEISFWENN